MVINKVTRSLNILSRFYSKDDAKKFKSTDVSAAYSNSQKISLEFSKIFKIIFNKTLKKCLSFF